MSRVINIQTAKLAFILAACLVLVFTFTANAGKVQVPEGTEISVKFPQGVKISSGKVAAGVPLLFELAAPIEIGGKVIIDKGATGTAVVKESVKAKSGGKPGKITIEFTELNAAGNFQTLDGSPIKLKGSVTKQGKKKGIFPYLFFVVFLKGGQGEIDTGQAYPATVAESVILEEKE